MDSYGRLSDIWKSGLTDKIIRSFFQAAVESILMYECITWMLTIRMEKKLDSKYVIYWPSTEPSIKRCTCVNKRKNSRSRCTLENNITRCPGGSSQLETGFRSENQLQTEGFGPLVTPGRATQAKMRKKSCYGREKSLGQYSSPSLSPLISYTQQTSPFRK